MRSVMLKLVSIVGFGCVLTSSCCAWFRVPVDILASADGDWEAIRVGVSDTEAILKVAVLHLLLLAAAVHHFTTRHQRTAAQMAMAGFCLCCFFPYCQTVREPQLAARATWLHLQHENLTWLGGDIFRNQEHERTPQQIQLYVTDSPRRVSVLPIPIWSLHQLDFGHLPVWFAWLGFTNAFCQFVCRGWVLAVCGTALFLISMVFAKPRQEMDLLRASIRALVFLGGLGMLMAWYSPLRASLLLNRAASLTSRGDHAAAVAQLERAAQVWRPLSEATDFVVQHGLSDLAAQRSTPYARLYQARLLERDGHGDLAISIYRQLTEGEPAESPIRREACRGALRHAERAANAGQWQQALAGTTFVTRHDPCNIKALYAALVCHMQLGDACAAEQALRQLHSVYGFLNYPNKRIVLGKAREMTVKTLLQQELTQGRPDANGDDALEAYNLSALPPRLTFAP